MPSSHASNWFSATMVLFLFYRKSLWSCCRWRWPCPFSRLYNGVHYPSDVLAGALIGAGYAWARHSLESAWQFIGKKWLSTMARQISGAGTKFEDRSSKDRLRHGHGNPSECSRLRSRRYT
ncbi:MAG: phosphatase PAP2 family protein [Limisphaerales bacterium]